ncbi:hypothetical protein G7059_02130 [Erysipelothrix sp. HDW6A]|uniref:hypothetical protein n=1 Tax=Erysipelothrix sp. HDW6A TaxID=2714928 RepID=UPI00140DFC94|nr:hypothetical protein [Erysipelothrix sp. HDW6A]QIK56730.1 hypothetical protein G7059_02130 [Erysipelothrix sp. HDW6A]
MTKKSNTLIISGIIVIAVTVFIAYLTNSLTTSHVYWILAAELITTVLSALSLRTNTGMKYSVLPLLLIYASGAILYSLILLFISGNSEKTLHIGQVIFLAITAIAYLIMSTTFGKKDISKY